jgi:DNA-binding NarL/FixJ family response regulator
MKEFLQMTQWRILIVDDHPLFRDALKLALSGPQANMLISEAGNLDQVNAFLTGEHEFDLVMLDLRMPGVQGFSGLVYLRSQFPSVPVVIVSGQDEPAIMRRALALGAAGYVPKSTAAEDIRQAVATILAGGIWAPEAATATASDPETEDLARRLASLTPQQLRVLMMLREGKLNKQIAFQLTVSEATIKAHVSAILQKLNVDSRTQAVIVASRVDGDMPDQ